MKSRHRIRCELLASIFAVAMWGHRAMADQSRYAPFVPGGGDVVLYTGEEVVGHEKMYQTFIISRGEFERMPRLDERHRPALSASEALAVVEKEIRNDPHHVVQVDPLGVRLVTDAEYNSKTKALDKARYFYFVSVRAWNPRVNGVAQPVEWRCLVLPDGKMVIPVGFSVQSTIPVVADIAESAAALRDLPADKQKEMAEQIRALIQAAKSGGADTKSQ
jgi:hypothetical protein